jgi:hypothetical protein
MTDPDTYIKSRADAVKKYIERHNLSRPDLYPIYHPVVVEKLLDHNLMMSTADKVYRSFVKHFKYPIPVQGEYFPVYRRRIVDYIVKYQRKKSYKDREMAEILQIRTERYNDMRREYKIKGRAAWECLHRLMDHRRKYPTRNMSQLSYWRNA